jgi:hypothetical protein
MGPCDRCKSPSRGGWRGEAVSTINRWQLGLTSLLVEACNLADGGGANSFTFLGMVVGETGGQSVCDCCEAGPYWNA